MSALESLDRLAGVQNDPPLAQLARVLVVAGSIVCVPLTGLVGWLATQAYANFVGIVDDIHKIDTRLARYDDLKAQRTEQIAQLAETDRATAAILSSHERRLTLLEAAAGQRRR